jgi:glycosyltransferase involved in cell wall biosynthesis
MNINIQAPLNSLGYGVVGTQLPLAISRLGHSVTLWPIGNIQAENKYYEELAPLIKNQSYFNDIAPSLRIWHQFDMGSSIGRGTRIGMPIFELDAFNSQERHHLRSLDKIFVCSEWAKKVVEYQIKNPGNYPKKVCVVPLGVDTNTFYLHGTSKNLCTIFINIGKWEYRKGHDILVKAFSAAFEPNDNVRLWMMNDNPFLSPEQTEDWHKLYATSKMGHKIAFLPRVRTQAVLANVMADADCGVFPSRAEGWNLELLEMMAMGKHVIATNYSGHTEYVTRDNCQLIDITQLEKANDGIWFHGDGNWCEFGQFQMDQLVEHMRKIHRLIQNTNHRLVNTHGIETARRFTWENSAKTLMSHLEE